MARLIRGASWKRTAAFGILLSVLLSASSALFARDPASVFELLDLHIGQGIDEARQKYPTMQCENSCVLEGQEAFGYPGRLWAGMKDGKIHQIAFGFKPALNVTQAEKVRLAYIQLYGKASDHLGVEGCDEWSTNGGYLAICLSPEISHIWWSTESRVDINIQNQRKHK